MNLFVAPQLRDLFAIHLAAGYLLADKLLARRERKPLTPANVPPAPPPTN